MTNFFEYLGLADMEKVHSQILAWMLSSKCQALSDNEKHRILFDMIKQDIEYKIEEVLTEYKNVDLYVRGTSADIAIENKIKSSQHSDQLERYYHRINGMSSLHSHFVFLTLLNEKAEHPEWQNYSYSELLEVLNQFDLEKRDLFDARIIEEYRTFLQRLTEVVQDFSNHPLTYDNVFKYCQLKKEQKVGIQYANANQQFLSDNQLETPLYMKYLKGIAENLDSPRYSTNVTETHGMPLAEFFFRERFPFQGRKYRTVFQFQGGTCKFAFTVADSKEYSKSKREWIDDVFPIFKELAQNNPHGYQKYNEPKGKAWVSITKKLDRPVHEIPATELEEILRQEIDNCYSMQEIVYMELASVPT